MNTRARLTAADDTPFRLQARSGETLIVRLLVRSQLLAPAMVAPELDAWVLDDGRPIAAESRAAPAHAYLAQGQEASITLTTRVPAGLSDGTLMRSGLRIPGLEDRALPLEVRIANDRQRIPEYHLSVSLPLSGSESAPDADVPGSKAIYTLVAGLAGAEVIPARWLVAELLLMVCEIGADFAATEEGSALLDKLARLRFFKNGVLAFRGAHLHTWIMVGTTVSSGLHATLGGQATHGRILYTWEKWLFDLVDTDIESASAGGESRLPPPRPTKAALERLGNRAEDWFGYLLLGLYRKSERAKAVLDALAANAPEPVEKRSSEVPTADDVLNEDGSVQR